MKYITGQHALNLECSLETSGDWHQSAIQWKVPFERDSNNSVFGVYGIEYNRKIPEHSERYCVANHIRALLDLIELGKFSLAQGMRNDFICNDKYTIEIFYKIMMLKHFENWKEIDNFMKREYKLEWLHFLKEVRM